MKIDKYIKKDGKTLQYGYTTGSCATASAKASAIMLLSQTKLESVWLMTPKGIELTLNLHDIVMENNSVTCGVQKDSGDDPDVTNQIIIYSKVEKIKEKKIVIDGGEGIGRVTKPGLNQPVGNAAINSVPRQMIQRELLAVCDEYNYNGGFSVTVFAPEGQERAVKTFNSRLGIIGGISILGTSGIVEPMSDDALIKTIDTEIDMQVANGAKKLVITPGNYGQDYIKQTYNFDLEKAVKTSNFIGHTLEYATECGVEEILLVGHIGKLVKLAGGLFNTHSRYGDCRAEIIASYAGMCGANCETIANIMDSATADEMIASLDKIDLRDIVMQKILERIEFLIDKKIFSKAKVKIIIFSQKYGEIVKSKNAESLL